MGASVKLVTIKISHCYNVHRRGCNSYKKYVVSILLQYVFVVTISLVTMQIGCNNVKIKYLLLQRLQLLRNVVTQILVAAINGICSVPNSSSELIFYKKSGRNPGRFFAKIRARLKFLLVCRLFVISEDSARNFSVWQTAQ